MKVLAERKTGGESKPCEVAVLVEPQHDESRSMTSGATSYLQENKAENF